MLDLNFKGRWRKYQKEVLDRFQSYQTDGHVHLVAAPGSGKTTIGIELIARFGNPALVLVPTVTIREQWVDRIQTAFLENEQKISDLVSQNLKEMKALTIVTYQAFHSAMNQINSKEEGEIEDFTGFNLLASLKEQGVGTFCLDECHHLRNEWWRSLEDFRKQYGQLQVISLTATPPYDSEPELWERYIKMCGEIDQEITVPELVKENTLCPHQDFVYICSPTAEESEHLRQFEDRKWEYIHQLLVNPDFQALVSGSKVLKGDISSDVLLEDPKYLSAILIFMHSQGLTIPDSLENLLGAKRLPQVNSYWLELLLQSVLYQTPDWYEDPNGFREKLESDLKARGLIEQRQVFLVKSKSRDKILNQSLGKLSGIADIFLTEYKSMGQDLRQLVLADYIRKDFATYLGDNQATISQLGVLPYFESIRRKAQEHEISVSLAVLSGSVVILPINVAAELKELLPQVHLSFSSIGQLDQEDYVLVGFPSTAKGIVAAVTELFQRGRIQVLVGTKSLLGEGWDAPCVNSLILGSFVGSFMLSNQMRGRAIRTWQGHPEKTSNIWHLVAVQSEPLITLSGEEPTLDSNQDLQTLSRRMEHFLGLAYNQESIETGLDRLDFPKPPFKKKQIREYNERIKMLSKDRAGLRKKWYDSLVMADRFEIVTEVATQKQKIPIMLQFDALKWVRMSLLLLAVDLLVLLFRMRLTGVWWLTAACLLFLSFASWRYLSYKSPYKRLQSLCEQIRKVLLDSGHLTDDQSRVQVEEDKENYMVFAYLKGGSMRDKELFVQTVGEFFAPVDNQRYLLKAEKVRQGQSPYYVVPSLFDKRKEEAQKFLDFLTPTIGRYHLVYTRTEAGRKILLEARIKALSNKNDRILTKKKVKSQLE
ncbi:DEAD/DEAH box helicase family protein [Streptococcus oralis]|uniref:DEAD/DEAH box helicase family protein n=1 Tax=Streptococcus oralis TaxID=1303 RepID=A0A7T2ZYE0_STROR|nr:DEAD/DEAH box helicase family protein [Streptococcus oralis]QPT02612.1 DEAD/DEAH box helicase family protein [Streptococcus oralis]CAK1608245.1 DEAD/DEAH box helicase family protein [Streptococcus oralis subsp. dentisani]